MLSAIVLALERYSISLLLAAPYLSCSKAPTSYPAGLVTTYPALERTAQPYV
jgi:hypothetical protein